MDMVYKPIDENILKQLNNSKEGRKHETEK